MPGYPVEDVVLDRVRVEAIGGEGPMSGVVPERDDAYPQCTMFGRLPAWGLYARHVRGLALRDVEFTARSADAREMVVLDDVTRVD